MFLILYIYSLQILNMYFKWYIIKIQYYILIIIYNNNITTDNKVCFLCKKNTLTYSSNSVLFVKLIYFQYKYLNIDKSNDIDWRNKIWSAVFWSAFKLKSRTNISQSSQKNKLQSKAQQACFISLVADICSCFKKKHTSFRYICAGRRTCIIYASQINISCF